MLNVTQTLMLRFVLNGLLIRYEHAVRVVTSSSRIASNRIKQFAHQMNVGDKQGIKWQWQEQNYET